MSYDSNYLAKKGPSAEGRIGFTEWIYHTTDTPQTIDTAGYISDAAEVVGSVAKHGAKGIRKGDLVHVVQWSALPDGPEDRVSPPATAPTITGYGVFMVAGISASTGAADLAAISWADITNED